MVEKGFSTLTIIPVRLRAQRSSIASAHRVGTSEYHPGGDKADPCSVQSFGGRRRSAVHNGGVRRFVDRSERRPAGTSFIGSLGIDLLAERSDRQIRAHAGMARSTSLTGNTGAFPL